MKGGGRTPAPFGYDLMSTGALFLKIRSCMHGVLFLYNLPRAQILEQSHCSFPLEASKLALFIF